MVIKFRIQIQYEIMFTREFVILAYNFDTKMPNLWRNVGKY